MRKLATIRKIISLTPIPEADFIECATVDGWELVVKKGEFEIGDLCVYFEIDSMLPLDAKYSFLKKVTKVKDGEGYRLKTIKLKRQISQGLALPLKMYPDLKVKLGEDVTKLLKVWKYERLNAGEKLDIKPKTGVKGILWKYFPKLAKKVFQKDRNKTFPTFIPKTDQERIQNLMKYFQNPRSKWEVSLKLDGSSMTVWDYKKNKAFNQSKLTKLLNFFSKSTSQGVCSRNQNLSKDNSNFWTTATKEGLLEIIKGKNIALQGELIGPGIQKNHEKVQAHEFRLFDIFDIKEQRYLLPAQRKVWLLENDLERKIKLCPIVSEEMLVFKEYQTFEELQKFVTGASMNKGTISEGRVFKNVTSGTSFKCISNKYLLKCED